MICLSLSALIATVLCLVTAVILTISKDTSSSSHEESSREESSYSSSHHEESSHESSHHSESSSLISGCIGASIPESHVLEVTIDDTQIQSVDPLPIVKVVSDTKWMLTVTGFETGGHVSSQVWFSQNIDTPFEKILSNLVYENLGTLIPSNDGKFLLVVSEYSFNGEKMLDIYIDALPNLPFIPQFWKYVDSYSVGMTKNGRSVVYIYDSSLKFLKYTDVGHHFDQVSDLPISILQSYPISISMNDSICVLTSFDVVSGNVVIRFTLFVKNEDDEWEFMSSVTFPTSFEHVELIYRLTTIICEDKRMEDYHNDQSDIAEFKPWLLVVGVSYEMGGSIFNIYTSLYGFYTSMFSPPNYIFMSALTTIPNRPGFSIDTTGENCLENIYIGNPYNTGGFDIGVAIYSVSVTAGSPIVSIEYTGLNIHPNVTHNAFGITMSVSSDGKRMMAGSLTNFTSHMHVDVFDNLTQ